MGKYFTVEVKPTIPTVAAGQHAAFTANDLLFDWFAFDIPKGTAKLVHMIMEVRPKGDSGATVNQFKVDLIFAKTVNGAAPTSLGTVNSALTADVNNSNHIIDYFANAGWVFEGHIDSTTIAQVKEAKAACFIEGEPDSGINVGYDRIYVAGICGGAFDFRSACLINNGDLNGPELTVNGTDPRLFLATGDTIAVTTTADTSVQKAMGVIKSVDSDVKITLESAFTTGDVTHEDIVYNVSPMKLTLCFEK